MCTSAGWAEALTAITADKECDIPDPETGNPGNCGNYMAGVAFMIMYLVLSFLIIVNMYIAVILENYSQATEDVQEGITDEDYDLFYEIWQEFDPDGTQYMPYKNLTEFLDVLEPPLQIAKPNKFKIVHMDIPICRYTNPESGEVKDNCVFCTDILDALTQDFFARKGNPIEEPPPVDEVKVSLTILYIFSWKISRYKQMFYSKIIIVSIRFLQTRSFAKSSKRFFVLKFSL